MTLAVEWKVATLLREVRPRDGFRSELLDSLTRTPLHLSDFDGATHPWRTRWIAAGAIAGVVSATGAAYLAHRNHHRRGAA